MFIIIKILSRISSTLPWPSLVHPTTFSRLPRLIKFPFHQLAHENLRSTVSANFEIEKVFSFQKVFKAKFDGNFLRCKKLSLFSSAAFALSPPRNKWKLLFLFSRTAFLSFPLFVPRLLSMKFFIFLYSRKVALDGSHTAFNLCLGRLSNFRCFIGVDTRRLTPDEWEKGLISFFNHSRFSTFLSPTTE